MAKEFDAFRLCYEGMWDTFTDFSEKLNVLPGSYNENRDAWLCIALIHPLIVRQAKTTVGVQLPSGRGTVVVVLRSKPLDVAEDQSYCFDAVGWVI